MLGGADKSNGELQSYIIGANNDVMEDGYSSNIEGKPLSSVKP